MPIEIMALGPALAGIGAAVKTIEFAYALDSVESDTSDYLNILRTITMDLYEAIRLRNLLSTSTRMPAEAVRRVDDVIDSAQTALQGVAKLVENPRADVKRKGGVGVGNRLLWVLRDSRNVQTKQMLLSTTHNSLLNIIGEMSRVCNGASGLVFEKGKGKGGQIVSVWEDDEEGEALRRALVVRHFKRRVEEEGKVVEEEGFQYITEQKTTIHQSGHSEPGTTLPQPTYTTTHSAYSQQQPISRRPNTHTPKSDFPYVDYSAPYPSSTPLARPPTYMEACREYTDPAGSGKEVVVSETICEPDLEVVPELEPARILFSRAFGADRLGIYGNHREAPSNSVSPVVEDDSVAQALWLARRFSSRGPRC